MNYPSCVRDIMSVNLTTLSPLASLKDAHDITKAQGIRHLPVVNQDNELLGIVTQKAMIARVIHLLNLYGGKTLPEQERSTNVMEIAVVDYQTVGPDDGLDSVAHYFLSNKHGCLAVVDQRDKLIGMLTSTDFVKLAVSLLRQNP